MLAEMLIPFRHSIKIQKPEKLIQLLKNFLIIQFRGGAVIIRVCNLQFPHFFSWTAFLNFCFFIYALIKIKNFVVLAFVSNTLITFWCICKNL